VNAKDDIGKTPLHQAAREGHKEIAELLIEKGADVNAKGWKGLTPLHFATSRGHKEIAELLIAKSANVNAKNDFGRTPLDLATVLRRDTETADLLRKHGGKTGEELKAEGK
jgi:cytohesin